MTLKVKDVTKTQRREGGGDGKDREEKKGDKRREEN